MLDADHDGIPCETLPAPPAVDNRDRESSPADGLVTLQVAGAAASRPRCVGGGDERHRRRSDRRRVTSRSRRHRSSIGASSNLNTAAGLTDRQPRRRAARRRRHGRPVRDTSSADLLADVVGYFTDGTAPVVQRRAVRADHTEPPTRHPRTTAAADPSVARSTRDRHQRHLTRRDRHRRQPHRHRSRTPGWVQLAAAPVHVGASSNVNVAYDGQTIANAVVSPSPAG